MKKPKTEKPKKKKKRSTKKFKADRVLKEWAKMPQDGHFEGAF
jgi:hypothetical protein